MLKKTSFPNTFYYRRKLVTINQVKDHSVYAERLMNNKGVQYREWQIRRSKLGTSIKKGLKNHGIRENSSCLYLGAASGTTVSHFSDILSKGRIYAVEFSAQTFSYLVEESKLRNNIVPILSDAYKTENYSFIVPKVDVVFQDVSQKNQVEIFAKNVKEFMKSDGFAYLSLKCKSIDVTKKNSEIYKEVFSELKKDFDVVESMFLGPYEKDHYLFVVKFKN